MSMDDLPLELQTEILLGLPLPSLAVATSVSKSLLSITRSPSFTARYFRPNNTHTLFLVRGPHLFSANLSSSPHSHSHSHHLEFDQIPLPGFDNFVPKLIGTPHNGLICINFLNRYLAFYTALPLRRARTVRIPNATYTSSASACFGFGYDPVGDDYKVLMIRKFYREFDDGNRFGLTEFCNEFRVYSLRTGRWNLIPRRAGVPGRHVYLWTYSDIHCVKGALHWLAIKRSGGDGDGDGDEKVVIVRFDLNGEEFGEVELPKDKDGGGGGKSPCKRLAMGTASLGGYLSFWTDNVAATTTFDVWIMKEYGVEESWTKLLSVRRGGLWGVGKFKCSLFSPSPIAFLEDKGKVLIQGIDGSGGGVGGNNTELFLYDLNCVKDDDDGGKEVGRALKKRKFQRISH